MKLWLLSTTDLFALGILLAVLSAWFVRRGGEPRLAGHPALPAVAWALAALAFWTVTIPLDLGRYPFGKISLNQDLVRQTLYGLFAFFLLVPGVFGPQNRSHIRRFLQSRPVQLVGLVSYGIFLWNLFVARRFAVWTDSRVVPDGTLRTMDGDVIPFALVLSVVVVVTLAFAAFSYIAVERPFLRLKRRTRARPPDG
jgi:peptidoglycan/LPS O-acetylase OafA/YrhL